MFDGAYQRKGDGVENLERKDRFLAHGTEGNVYSRNNQALPVLLKVYRQSPPSIDLLDRIALMLCDTPDREMASHFAVEVRHKNKGGRPSSLVRKVNGPTLESFLADASIAPSVSLDALTTMAAELQRAVAWFNRQGFKHGDIRPANILLDLDAGKLVLIDFGHASSPDIADESRNLSDWLESLIKGEKYRTPTTGEEQRPVVDEELKQLVAEARWGGGDDFPDSAPVEADDSDAAYAAFQDEEGHLDLDLDI